METNVRLVYFSLIFILLGLSLVVRKWQISFHNQIASVADYVPQLLFIPKSGKPIANNSVEKSSDEMSQLFEKRQKILSDWCVNNGNRIDKTKFVPFYP